MTQRINEKVGAWLLEEGNTRSMLAQEIGISRPVLNSRLNGSSKWSWNEVVKISQITGCTLNELAGISDERCQAVA